MSKRSERLIQPVETVLIIPDTQYPFAHRDHLEFLRTVKERYQPTKVVHIGDCLDFHALSDYDHSPDGDSPGEEFKKAMKDMERLYELFPEVQVMLSNHDSRVFRRAYKAGIPKAFVRDYPEFMRAPVGWTWHNKVEIDGILYQHGNGSSGKFAHLKRALENMQSTVMGHLHSNAGVAWARSPKCLIFALAVACLIDVDAYAFEYGETSTSKPILGCGIVDKGLPGFIPMLLRRGGRWVGRL